MILRNFRLCLVCNSRSVSGQHHTLATKWQYSLPTFQTALFTTSSRCCNDIMSAGSVKSHYQVLGLPTSASKKEIKGVFKELSKKYHPDLNTHLSEPESEQNKQKYINIVNSYEVLKDDTKRRNYDLTLDIKQSNDRSMFEKKYYGEAKYYSRSGSSSSSSNYTRSGYNIKRNRVHYGEGVPYRDRSNFSGRPNEGGKYDVPHFDYDSHLNKNLKMELRNLNKKFDVLQQRTQRIIDTHKSEYDMHAKNINDYKENLDKHKYNKEQYIMNLKNVNSFHQSNYDEDEKVGKVLFISLSLIASLIWYMI